MVQPDPSLRGPLLCVLLAGQLTGGCPAERRPQRDERPGATLPAAAAADRSSSFVTGEAEEKEPWQIVDSHELRRLSVRSLSMPRSAREKALAYHLIQACEAGHRIGYAQHHRLNLELKDLLEAALENPRLSLPLREKLERYMARFWLHLGHHDLGTGVKFVAPFTEADLRLAAEAARTRGLPLSAPELDTLISRLEPALFASDVDPRLTADPSAPGSGDSLAASAVDYYRGISAEEALAFKHRYSRNSRLVKQGKLVVEEVWRVGGEGAPPGVYADELGQVVAKISEAVPFARGEQRRALEYLARHLETGDPEAFGRYLRLWAGSDAPVELVLGFISTHRDPLGLKGAFQCVVAACAAGVPAKERGRERSCELLHAVGDLGADGHLPRRFRPDVDGLPAKTLVFENVERTAGGVAIPPVYLAVRHRVTGEIREVKAHWPATWVGFNLARARAWRLWRGQPLQPASRPAQPTP